MGRAACEIIFERRRQKPASRALKRLTEAFAQQAQLYSPLNAYLLEHIRKHNDIRTKNEFFANSYPTA